MKRVVVIRAKYKKANSKDFRDKVSAVLRLIEPEAENGSIEINYKAEAEIIYEAKEKLDQVT